MVNECLRFNLLFLCDLFGFCYLYFRILSSNKKLTVRSHVENE